MTTHLHKRIDDLETQLAFQEDTIQSLNQALINQQLQISALEHNLGLLAKKLKGMQPDAVASMSEETPPPHY
ncbi:SlyX family protein [Catenovulum agarivorans DS-2]|uniref:Protein SlyX homolog n=1 Tax=Catenovulum agarivorans DS-2 TaxID=1328313 RepID=W7QYB9_9ALTE|nr:SlyX family protein [Catenovulum agarivorans]EWH10325.1 SlyX family protein [Catenovulum agarivorans DS-2]